MPSKKNKNQPRNAFYFYMVSLRPQLERQGVVLENGMQTLSELAGPRWKELPEHEKEIYQEMARQAKNNRKHGALRNDRMDCTGELISRRVDTISLNENKRRKEREEVRHIWPPGKLVADERFYMIGFMSLLPEHDDELPVEVGVAEFTLNGGITRTLHRFIRPGEIPLGFRYEAMSNSEKSHKIPVNGLAKKEDNYRRILLDILKFVNPEGAPVFPPVYSRASETKQTDSCLDWLARHAEMPNKLRKVYELEGLICDLFSHVDQRSEYSGISKAQASDLLSSTVFDFEPGARCDWHEQQEVKFCALGTAKRYCYCMADFLCPKYEITLTPSHVPERPEGTFCTTLNEPGLAPMTLRAPPGRGSTTTSNDPFPSRDYRYKGMTPSSVASSDAGGDDDEESSQYHRSGPTYDMRSLQNDPIPDQQQRLLQQQRQQQQQQFAQGSNAFRPLGRGRGRGAPMGQPLRRPMAPGRVPSAGRGARVDGSWGNTAPTETTTETVAEWARVGRGSARQPDTRPKVYAGAATAPHPSFAPPPPIAWQRDQYNPSYQQDQDFPPLRVASGGYPGNTGSYSNRPGNVEDMDGYNEVAASMARMKMGNNY
ncbi:protein maelstrom homolog [Nematostella vectensis]|uniref:protein maelstrom homolog n=1 Tax=Nematostella vectensis TaxID=45351 RepID=UPI002077812B|nr:protein maelstrom homolog [Nematostella vectensis]